MELRMSTSSPSIIPTHRLDRDTYLVLEGFRSGAAWRETDEDRVDYATLINDLLASQYGPPLRVVAFNPTEGWSRDATEDVALELAWRVYEEGRDIPEALREFIESHTVTRSACNWRCRLASASGKRKRPNVGPQYFHQRRWLDLLADNTRQYFAKPVRIDFAHEFVAIDFEKHDRRRPCGSLIALLKAVESKK
jgi:hypothetical protein